MTWLSAVSQGTIREDVLVAWDLLHNLALQAPPPELSNDVQGDHQTDSDSSSLPTSRSSQELSNSHDSPTSDNVTEDGRPPTPVIIVTFHWTDQPWNDFVITANEGQALQPLLHHLGLATGEWALTVTWLGLVIPIDLQMPGTSILRSNFNVEIHTAVPLPDGLCACCLSSTGNTLATSCLICGKALTPACEPCRKHGRSLCVACTAAMKMRSIRMTAPPAAQHPGYPMFPPIRTCIGNCPAEWLATTLRWAVEFPESAAIQVPTPPGCTMRMPSKKTCAPGTRLGHPI